MSSLRCVCIRWMKKYPRFLNSRYPFCREVSHTNTSMDKKEEDDVRETRDIDMPSSNCCCYCLRAIQAKKKYELSLDIPLSFSFSFFDIYLNDCPPFQISIKEIVAFLLVALYSSRDWKPLSRKRISNIYRLSLSH